MLVGKIERHDGRLDGQMQQEPRGSERQQRPRPEAGGGERRQRPIAAIAASVDGGSKAERDSGTS